MKRKETKFYLGTILVLVSYYSIFNLVAKLDSVNQLSDFGFYGIQILLIVMRELLPLWFLSRVNVGKSTVDSSSVGRIRVSSFFSFY